LKNRLTELFGIRYPIVQAGMVWCSGYRLAAAVANAGGLGLIGAGSMRPDVLREHIVRARAGTDRPFGVNIPLICKYAPDFVEICREARIPIVFTSAGSPKKHTAALKAGGAVVVHVVANVTMARKCEEAGVDAVVAEGFEAGGHNGVDELTTLVLVPQVVDAVSIPVIAAGGIADGRSMAAALALGADGVQVGTRFAASEESSAHPAFKQAIVAAPDTATALLMKKIAPVRLIKNEFARRIMELEAAGAPREALQEWLGSGRARRGMFEGDLAEGELEIGQIAGAVREILPAEEIVRRLVAGYEAVRGALPSLDPPGK
jgi:enoyl-[acyl-carrier protein] reductase II